MSGLEVAVVAGHGGRGGHGGAGGPRWHVVIDLALLQELFCMKGVEGTEVMDHGHELGEDGLVLGVLGEQDGVEDHLEFVLDAHQKLGVP